MRLTAGAIAGAVFIGAAAVHGYMTAHEPPPPEPAPVITEAEQRQLSREVIEKMLAETPRDDVRREVLEQAAERLSR